MSRMVVVNWNNNNDNNEESYGKALSLRCEMKDDWFNNISEEICRPSSRVYCKWHAATFVQTWRGACASKVVGSRPWWEGLDRLAWLGCRLFRR